MLVILAGIQFFAAHWSQILDGLVSFKNVSYQFQCLTARSLRAICLVVLVSLAAICGLLRTQFCTLVALRYESWTDKSGWTQQRLCFCLRSLGAVHLSAELKTGLFHQIPWIFVGVRQFFEWMTKETSC